MGSVDLKSGTEKKLDAKQLEKQAPLLRAQIVTPIHAAGSGHPGGSLSAIDIMNALFFNALRHSPGNPYWEERDRFFLSKAHIVPALYSVLGASGYFKPEEMATLRKLGSPFQGHSDMLKCGKYGIEVSGGSLGQGLGIAVGDALAARIDGAEYWVYCMMGDGEQQEGSVWESAMSAGHFKLDNLTAIVDKNDLQIDGKTCVVMDIDPLAEKYRAFNWHVIEINGHNYEEILKAFPDLECADIREALQYAAEAVRERELPLVALP